MDREKVINDLQDAVNDDWMWQHADYYAKAMENALALLKEDCHNCKLECLLQKYDELKEKYDALLEENASNEEMAEGLKDLLKEQEAYISKETRLNRDEYCRVGDVLDCFDGMDMKADEVFHAVCLIEWAMSKRSVPLDQLLKEQEAVKPKCKERMGGFVVGLCPTCGTALNNVHNVKACGKCGQAVKWNG